MKFFFTEIGKFRHREVQHLEPSDPGHRRPTPILTYNVWLHASNQTASQRAMLHHTPPLLPPTSHSTTSVPAFFPTQNGCSTPAGLLIDPPPLYPAISYSTPLLLLCDHVFHSSPCVNHFLLSLLPQTWPSFNIWLMSPPLHKVLLNNHNLHSVTQIIQ